MPPLKDRLRAGEACMNGWLAIPDGFAAEVMAQAGYDSLTVDLQHGMQDYRSMVRCFQAAGAHPPALLARVPWNEPGIIGRTLDAGAQGVICPMVNTGEDCARFVRACLYPPAGQRSNGPVRAALVGPPGAYQATANDRVLVIPMIETIAAVDNLDAILDVPGIDGIYVGPSDLGFSMGLRPSMDREEPEVLRIYERLVTATARRRLWAGLHNTAPDYAARMLGMGFRFVTVDSDSGLLGRAAAAAVAQTRAHASRAAPVSATPGPTDPGPAAPGPAAPGSEVAVAVSSAL